MRPIRFLASCWRLGGNMCIMLYSISWWGTKGLWMTVLYANLKPYAHSTRWRCSFFGQVYLHYRKQMENCFRERKEKMGGRKETVRNSSPYQCYKIQGYQSQYHEIMVLLAYMKFSGITMRELRRPNSNSQSKVLIIVTPWTCHNHSSNQILHTD